MNRAIFEELENRILLSGDTSIAPLAQTPWTGTWSVSPQSDGGDTFSQQTVRQTVFTSIGGTAARIRLSNLFGSSPVTISDIHIALVSSGSSIQSGTDHVVTFGGSSSVTVGAGADVNSDSIAFTVPSLSSVAISFYLPNSTPVQTFHQLAMQSTYVANGDVSSSATISPSSTHSSYFFLTNLDVQNAAAIGAVATVGASITDGYGSTQNANDRWPNFLAQRLSAAGITVGVLNQGISGNELLSDGAGPSAEHRFAHDALGQPNVQWVVFSDDPINDVGNNSSITGAQLIAGVQQLISQAHAAGLKFIGSTLTPFHGAGYWTQAGENAREQYNAFILSANSGCDGVIDQDAATHDPNNPTQFLPAYDSGDHLHPNDAGYQAIANAVNLSLFTSAPLAPTGLAATAGNAQVSLAWTGSAGATSYNVYRGTTAGGESSTPIATGLTGTTYMDTGLSNGVAYFYKVAAVGGSGTSGLSNEATATPHTTATSFKINFQDTTSQGFTGYLADTGQVYGVQSNGFTYGWNISNSANARNRNAANSPDERYDTLDQMQRPGGATVWEIAVPNGTYSVHIVAGDPSYIDSVYKINVENVLAINGTPTASTHWFDNTVTVTVSDGRLTISNATGSQNNKIDFIDVTTAGADTTPPTVTAKTPDNGTTVTTSSANIDVTFSEPVKGVDSTDLVLSGAGAASAVKGTPTNISGNTWRFPVSGLVNGAVNVSLAPTAGAITDLAGNSLANVMWAFNVNIPAVAFSAKINFQTTSSQGYTGYLADTGLVYGDRGNGFTYGWNIDNTANARNRNAANSTDERYDTLAQMQRPGSATVWEIAVPNGTYTVRIVAGDPSYIDSVYKINVEGVLAINGTPTATTHWFDNTVTVTVTDGRLTVSNATGSMNNKIDFIEITSV